MMIMNMMPAIKTDTRPPAKPIPSPRPRRSPHVGVAAHDPFRGAQEHSDEAGDRREQQEVPPTGTSSIRDDVVVEERLEDEPAEKCPEPAGQAQIEIARVNKPDEERLGQPFPAAAG